MLTQPNNFPEKTGIDERDQNHPFSPRKVVKVFLRPLSQKIIEKDLWFETIFVIMIFFTGFGELVGRKFSIEWYIILLFSLTLIGLKSFKQSNIPKEHLVPTSVDENKTKTD